MHSYLRAIGFSKLEQKDLDQILQEVIVSCDEKKGLQSREKTRFLRNCPDILV